jgi:ABC-type transporter Mla maintaining outer membrane lipid asymmetry ATPase subunit MlaF
MMPATNGEPAIALHQLRKHFGRQEVLAGVDLRVAPGETVAVLGRSGVGKSVLLKLIIGLQRPDSGSICIHGRDIVGLPVEQLNAVRVTMGFLFQEAALYDSLTLEDNVAFPLRRHQRWSRAERRERAGAACHGHVDARRRPAEARRRRNGSVWRGRWRSIRTSCCSTNRPPAWIPSRPPRSTN